MAAYAAVVSLMNTMDAVMNDPRLSTCFDEQQIRSLEENLDILLQFIENCDHNSLGSDDAQSLEHRITSAAHMAEDVIESHIVAQIHAGVLEDAPSSSIDLHQIMHDIVEIKEEVVKVAEKTGSNHQTPKHSPQPLQSAGKITMIGFDDYLLQLLDGLTGSDSGRQVIPIVGMGGVGKTTLTKNAYENSLTVQHFDVRAWVSISQQYDVKVILVQLLSSLGQSADEKNELCELSECLYKYLYGRRYLIVLDDMWNIAAWDKIKSCFPEGSDSSRIIVTTRLLEVANDFGSSSAVRVGLLDDDESWDLFCDKAFSQQSCPDELEEIGKTIVKRCKGLPLSIVVIGSLLGKSSQAREHWENIAGNMSSILSSSDDCLDILCLSYNHLPAQLKPCFLYLATFKEDDEVSVSELIKLWIAEGFIKPNKEQMLEEAAEGYVYDLLERSLILVDIYSLGWNKKFSRFRIHDLVRDLCLREAHKEKLFFVISTHNTTVEEVEVMLHCPFTLKFFDIFKNVNMRFHSCEIYGKGDASAYTVYTELPRSIFLLWSLQTLIVRNYRIIIKAPIEIWKMRQLRHVVFERISLPEPPLREEEGEFVVLHNLQTLERVVDLRFSEEVCKRIPNIKRLEVYYQSFPKNSNNYYCLQNVGRLNKIESLSFEFSDSSGDHSGLFRYLTFPASLKELSLFNSNLEWNDLGTFGSLPNLEVLKISRFPRYISYYVGEWKCVEGKFLALKHLILEYLSLERWIVEGCHFPVLDTLTLIYVDLRRGIPLDIGKIPTLRVIRVRSDGSSLPISAMRLLKEQEDLGNELLQLQLEFYCKKRVEEFLEKVEKKGLTCTNFTCVICGF